MAGRFGLLGERLSHSFSPLLHGMLADYEYRLYEKAPEDVAAFLRSGAFDGLNVTIPYKKTVLPFCAELSDAARRIGSVNTLVRRADGTLFGDNTDAFGFAYMAGLLHADFRGRKALVLGSGGASATAQAVLRKLGADPVLVVSRRGPVNYENLDAHADAEILVNTTPVGMYPHADAAPVSLARLPRLRAVLDLIYNPARTELLLDAEARGVPAVGGLPMLAAQAKAACERFTGARIDDAVIPGLMAAVERQTKNIVLIGMPGSGKTTVGRILAVRTGRPFLDTDDLAADRAGIPVPDFLRQNGEPAFRRLESEILADAASGSGRVLATGGGIVTVPENRKLLRRNSIAVFLDRPPADLPTAGRPLSQSRGVDALYRERLPLYTAWCDLRVENPASPEAAAEEILKNLGLEAKA